MFSMILRRMEWMEEKGIRQWNVAEYDEIADVLHDPAENGVDGGKGDPAVERGGVR